MAEETIQPTMTQRFLVQIVGAEPVDLPAGNAAELLQAGHKSLAGYKIALVAVLPEADAGALIARAKGHRIPVETIDAI